MRTGPRSLIVFMVTAVLLAWPATAGAAPAADCSGPGTYTVRRGDTASALARRFGTSVTALASLNRLADANRIYTGQVLTLPLPPECVAGGTSAGAAALAPTAAQDAGAVIHVVQRAETLSAIAARYNVTVAVIVAANGIANPGRIFVGQRLTVPSPAVGGVAPPATNPALPGLRLVPAVAEQGRVLWITLPAEGVAQVSGALGDWPVTFFREGDLWIGLVGIYALAETGSHTLALTVADAAGGARTYTQPVYVASGGYLTENLTLSPETTQLLDPALTLPEREHVAATVSARTPQRYWQGVFARPAGGRITSAFGTRRSYNGGPASSFHGGTDFSARGGLEARAPAPGMVVLAEPLIVRGNAVIIDHGWGVYSGFWHLAEIQVSVGDRVEAGQAIGQIGSTGLSTGAHLHWELFVNGVQVDGLQWTQLVMP